MFVSVRFPRPWPLRKTTVLRKRPVLTKCLAEKYCYARTGESNLEMIVKNPSRAWLGLVVIAMVNGAMREKNNQNNT